jgi:hypothetical protein
LGVFPGTVAVAAFYSGDDQYRRVIVAQQNGTVTEIFYHPEKGRGEATLGTFVDPVDVGAFWSNDDGYRHAIVATVGGAVTECLPPATRNR